MKIVKKIILLVVIGLNSLPAIPQKAVSVAKQSSVIKMIEKTASETKSIQCKFRQVKRLNMLNEELVSTGMMFYRQPTHLRWEYVQPYEYTFIINDTEVMMKSSMQHTTIDARQSRLFSEITQIMVNSVTGKCLTEKSDFDVTIYNDNEEWVAHLQPLKKELKSVLKLVKLHIHLKKYIISQIELVEKTGDVTIIYLLDYKTNIDIDEKMFIID